MLPVLEKRVGKSKRCYGGGRSRHGQSREPGSDPSGRLSLVVAAAQPERVSYFDQYEDQACWQEIVREPTHRNEGQQKRVCYYS